MTKGPQVQRERESW